MHRCETWKSHAEEHELNLKVILFVIFPSPSLVCYVSDNILPPSPPPPGSSCVIKALYEYKLSEKKSCVMSIESNIYHMILPPQSDVITVKTGMKIKHESISQ